MITAADTNVLIHVIQGRLKAIEILAKSAEGGQLIIAEIVYAELCAGMSKKTVDQFLDDYKIDMIRSSPEVLALAGQLWREHIERGGRRGHIIADFFIGAHAKILGNQLLSFDRGFYSRYFKGLKIVS